MEKLWQKDPNGVYIDIFDGIETDEVGTRTGLVKSEALSINFLRNAQQNVEAGKTVDVAMHCCNKGLLFAVERDTKCRLNGYRATCFMDLEMFDKCLTDCERYANTEDIECRETALKIAERCLKRKSRSRTIPTELKRELSYPENENFPGLADVVEVRRNAEIGLHVVAKCFIPVGKTIVVEKPVWSTTLLGSLIACATCQRNRMNFSSCDNCTIDMFCDDRCKEASLHEYDCNLVYAFQDPPFNSELKMIAQTIYFVLNTFDTVDELIQFVEDTEKIKTHWLPDSIGDAKSKYRLFLTLDAVPHRNKKKNLIKKSKTLYGILIERPAVNRAFDTIEKKQFLKHLITKHVIIACENTVHSAQDLDQRIDTLGLVLPLFKHACTPNLLNFYIDDRQVCITLRPVQKDEQLLMPEDIADLATKLIQLNLMKNLDFMCKCDRCEKRANRSLARSLLRHKAYRVLLRHCKSDFTKSPIRLIVRAKCIILLNKFGHVWFPELEFVMEMYIKSEMYEHPKVVENEKEEE